MKNIKQDNQGMIIVFTLILLAVFLTTALSFSYFIIGDINKARAIDDSIIAYYAADAGMEESLYLLKNQELANNLNDLVTNIRPDDVILLASGGIWDITGSTNYEKTVLRQRLYNGQSAKFFILNREDLTNLTRSISVEWHKGDGTAPKLQVNLTQLSPLNQGDNLIYFTDISVLEAADFDNNGVGLTYYNLKDLNLNGEALANPSDYLVEFKVLGGASGDFVDRLIVRANIKQLGDADYSNNFIAEGITNPTLKSKGTYGKATQNIFAYILPRDPVSGILSFVLFSEEDVTKE